LALSDLNLGFECPQRSCLFYGSLYILGPAILFICTALVLSLPFWEFVTECCRLKSNKRLLTSPGCAVEVYLGISGPFILVFLELLGEEYYFCAMNGPAGWELKMHKPWSGLLSNVPWMQDARAHCVVLV